jgi:hypothetical protein
VIEIPQQASQQEEIIISESENLEESFKDAHESPEEGQSETSSDEEDQQPEEPEHSEQEERVQTDEEESEDTESTSSSSISTVPSPPPPPPSPPPILDPFNTFSMFSMASIASPVTLAPFDPAKDYVEDWLERFEALSVGAGWDPKKQIGFLPLFLNEVARQWLQDWKREQAALPLPSGTSAHPPPTYAETKAAMIKDFTRDGKDKIKASSQLRERKQKEGESIDAYIYSCIELANRANKNMPEEKKVKAIIRGLREYYFTQTFMKGFSTVAELKKHLRELEDARLIFGRQTDYTVNAVSTEVIQEKRLEAIEQILQNISVGSVKNEQTRPPRQEPYQPQQQRQRNQPRQNRGNQQQQPQRANSRTNDGRPICFNCRGIDHLAAKCTQPPFCMRCKVVGHKTRECAEGIQQQNTRPQPTSNSTNVPRTSGNAQGRT